MPVRQLLTVNRLREAVAEYVNEISVPPIHVRAVDSRRTALQTLSRAWRQVRYAAAAGAVFIAALALSPSVIAQVERIMQAFTVVNGHTVQLPVKDVTLEQLRADMPFSIIAPAGIPADMQSTIIEVGQGSDSARAIFQYSRNSDLPGITIAESRAVPGETSEMPFAMTYRKPNTAGMLPRLPPQRYALRQGGTQQRVRLQTITFTERGTRVELLIAPGAFTRAEIEAITRAMERGF